MEAEYLLSESIEPDTGYPGWMTHGKDALGAFEAEATMNYAREVLEKARNGEKKPPAGRGWRLKYIGGAGED